MTSGMTLNMISLIFLFWMVIRVSSYSVLILHLFFRLEHVLKINAFTNRNALFFYLKRDSGIINCANHFRGYITVILIQFPNTMLSGNISVEVNRKPEFDDELVY